jgi:hypothetical protein
LISVEVKIGLLVGKTDQVECSALLCEGPAEEAVFFVVIRDLSFLAGTWVCLAIVVILFGFPGSARILERECFRKDEQILTA